jgi:threonine/homoserine/homoserine lactone efflux protein
VQALFFLASIFAGVGILKANLATGLAAVGIIVLGNGCYLMLLAWLMQKPAARRFYGRYRPSMEVGFGAVFVLFGARLLARELAGWP